jgi:hypothetical protein
MSLSTFPDTPLTVMLRERVLSAAPPSGITWLGVSVNV